MDTILTPLSFKTRRAPVVGKVLADSDRMYAHARYVIVLDEHGNVTEERSNRRLDDNIVDCLAVFAPFVYKGVALEKALVLEIGFRRFVPYAETEYRPNSSTRRGPKIRRRKGDEVTNTVTPIRKLRNQRPKTLRLKDRVPVAFLTDDAMFDAMPAITRGIQSCVDDIVLTWTNTSQNVRWARAGNKARAFWMKHEMEHSISMRIPKEAELLCATATFADLAWRFEPGGHIDISARAIKDMLKYYFIPGRRKGRDARGNFSADYVREGAAFHWVAERLKQKVSREYSTAMVEGLFDFIGPPGSMERKLVEQIWRIHKVPQPKKDTVLQGHQSEYGEMKNLLLERWLVRNYRSLWLKKKKKVWVKERTSEKPYFPHATNSSVFNVFASKGAQNKMTKDYCSKRAEEQTSNVHPILADSKISYIPAVEDDDVPWVIPDKKTGTDDNSIIPF